MKKLLISVIVFMCLIGTALGAGDTFVVTSDDIIYNSSGPVMRVITCTYTANSADATLPTLTIYQATATYPRGYWTDGTTTQGTPLRMPIIGWSLYQIEIDGNTGGTEITENCDIQITKNGYDLLAGKGADMMDNSAERMVPAYATDLTSYWPIMAPITDTIIINPDASTENAVNSAAGTVKLILVPGL